MSAQDRRLLLLNGNTTADLTARMHQRACTLLGPNWAVSAETAGFGFSYVTDRRQLVVAGHAILAKAGEISEGEGEFDSCLIACFGEPAIAAVREALPCPVVGMAEAAVLCALQLSRRYAIVTVGEHWPAMIEDYLRAIALYERCVGVIPIPGTALDLGADEGFALRQISVSIEQAIDLGADAVIVGGAAIADCTDSLQGKFRVPVINSFDAGLAQVEALSRLRPKRSSDVDSRGQL